MCGIVGYVGLRSVPETLLDGLKRLEYRGYDSSGMALLNDGKIIEIKNIGKVINLEKKASDTVGLELKNGTGIAHTRWATHGFPSEINAHPHLDAKHRFAIVHNGIIENYQSLKTQLQEKGIVFKSETDSEVLVHLISECYNGNLLEAVATALKKVNGTYGLAVISLESPGTIIAARHGSPLLIGLGEGESFIASDAAALVAFTRRVIYLNDHDVAQVTSSGVEIRNLDNIAVNRDISKIDWEPGAVEKSGFEHFMLKEICEQPEAVGNSIRGRLDLRSGNAHFNALNLSPYELSKINRIVIAACGTSMHAGMVGRYFFEDLASIPVDVEQAAEFRYRNPIIQPDTMVLPVSQSGETADTLAAVREAANKGAIVTAICNVVGSTIARESEHCIYLHAGPEIGVASTKAFTCQVTVLLMLAMLFGRNRRMSYQNALGLIAEIETIPELIKKVLDQRSGIEAVAKKYAEAEDFFYIGRGYLYPVALEGALKLKEISYIHAEGYHAAELKHGPIALLEENVPVVALANDLPGKEKMISNIQECRARCSPVIATVTAGDESFKDLVSDIITIPACSQFIAPVVTAVALQLFAYYVAKERGCEIDQPRNLAKSVTVE
ncbi:MAG: glutamine--fructose-6-phosphate transaminase (isomerizing) [Victivallaceae bacterium]|nr:glutamine--fructose-6-phosphate transaminase (isomerizing) [Victivallaceae bacterium]MDD4318233.1 glutamine--fructose-6-phosphate transaminase (isomerizing) [Victivallaceae bacterium]MDD5663429.1 glutamine--fructose-6-phosphate transaminase (isomerizing) [Victivallaceae bacterium]